MEEKLWRYEGLARLWSWSLIAAAAGLLLLAVPLEAGSPGGIDGLWVASLVGTSGITGLVVYPFLRMWLRRSAMPSLRLGHAEPGAGRRRLEASRADWRRWALLTTTLIFLGGAATMVFLIAMLGRGGVAEGVTVGIIAVWGVATLSDTRRIRSAEIAEGRRYYAACKRPTGVAHRLVWIPDASTDGELARSERPGARA